MAAIGESVTLCTHVDEKELVSVTDSGSENEVLLTMKSSNVTSYNVTTQKPIKSWSVPRMLNLQSPTIWNERCNSYVTINNQKTLADFALFVPFIHQMFHATCATFLSSLVLEIDKINAKNNKIDKIYYFVSKETLLCGARTDEIRTWSKTDQCIEKAHKKRFKFSLHKVLDVDGYEPIVICQNGAVEFLSNLDSSFQPKGHLYGDDEILICEAYKFSQDICVACLVKRKNCEILLLLNTYKSKQWIYSTHKLDENNCKEGLSYDFILHGSVLRTLILDSDGRLQSVDYNTESKGQTSRYLCTLPGVSANTKMVALNWSHVALAGFIKDKQDCVGIFNTKFGSLQDWKPLPEQGKSGLKLFTQHQHLIVLCGRCVHCYSYDCKTSSIDSILGNLSSSEVNNPSSSGLVSWNKTFSSKHTKDTGNVNELFQQLVTQASNLKKKQFTGLVERYLIVVDNEGLNPASLSTYMGQIVDLCLSTEGFWPRDAIHSLIKRGAIPYSKLQRLFDCLMSHNEAEMILHTVTKMKEVPEICICKCLEYILSCEDSLLENAINSLNVKVVQTAENCPLCWAKMYFLNSVLILPCNNLFLLEHLRKVPFGKVLELLKYLNYILNEGKQSDPAAASLPFVKVVDWMCHIVDSHVTQLIISPDARQILLDLHDVVQSQLQLYEELVILDTLLAQLKEKSTIPRSQKVGQYCIEVLHIL